MTVDRARQEYRWLANASYSHAAWCASPASAPCRQSVALQLEAASIKLDNAVAVTVRGCRPSWRTLQQSEWRARRKAKLGSEVSSA